MSKILENYDYDVCLSYAGEQRPYVSRVAKILRDRGARVFYDDYEKTAMWGKNLYDHLSYIYGKSAQYCLLFTSKSYASKVWTNHERQSAQARALLENSEYILPVRFDDTEIPGLNSTIAYVNATNTTPEELADMVWDKIEPWRLRDYFPPNPERLHRVLNLVRKAQKKERDFSTSTARAFFESLRRMDQSERTLVSHILLNGCTHELPENIHISLDLIRRELGYPPAETMEMLRKMSSLGIRSSLRPNEDDGDSHVRMGWTDRGTGGNEAHVFARKYSTEIAMQSIDLATNMVCECHRHRIIELLDFSALSLGVPDSPGKIGMGHTITRAHFHDGVISSEKGEVGEDNPQ